jgi:predicted ribosomally synthesized peptide with SipW-like signal peptide
MADQRYDVSRRKLLGAMGTIGGAAALGGAGTLAFFSDSDEFANNQLVAGELDLLVDWEEHYSDWSDDEDVGGVRMIDYAEPPDQRDPLDDDEVALPTVTNPMVAVEESRVGAFMNATAVEAFPDTGTDPDGDPTTPNPNTPDDGVQDVIPADNECEYIKQFLRDDAGNWLSALDSDARTNTTRGGPPNAQTTAPGDPLVQVSDVKPGDFGEVTFSLHLCDNPGYIWVNGELRENAENGLTGPEAKDDDEDDGSGVADPDAGGDQSGELADEIMVTLWYDTGETLAWDGDPKEGDNIQQSGEPIVEDFVNNTGLLSGRLSTVLEMLNSNSGRGIPLDGDLTDSVPVSVSPASVGPGSVDAAGDFTRSTGTVDCPTGLLEAVRIPYFALLVLGKYFDKTANQAPFEVPVSIGTDGETGLVTIHDVSLAGRFSLQIASITLGTDFPVNRIAAGRYFSVDKSPIWGTDPGVTLDRVTIPGPDPAGMSRLTLCYDPDELVPPQQTQPVRSCFEASTTAYLGLAWWLPVDHANEIQGDSVAFDLGFYTEQCRHNDGSGMVPEGRSTVSVDASDPTADSISRHQVEVEVGDDLDGHTLGELVVDYPSDFDISDVDPADASDLSYDVDPSFGGALPQVVPTVTQVNRSDDDTRISFTLSNSLPLAALEQFSLEYGDAQNASSAGTYSVDVEINGVAVGSADLSITT